MQSSSKETLVHSPLTEGLKLIIHILETVNPFIKWIGYGLAILLFIFMCFTFADVLLRYVFNRPIPSSTDISGFFLSAFVFLGLGFVQLKKRHMYVDVIISKLPAKAAIALSIVIYIVCIAIIGLMVWRGALNALNFYHLGIKGSTGLLLFPHALLMPIGALLFLIVLIRDALDKIVEGIKLRLNTITWVLTFLITILWIVLTTLLIQQIIPAMNGTIQSSIAIAASVILLFLGMPIALVLLVLGFMIIGYSLGMGTALMVPGLILYSDSTIYGFSIIPLFTLMGYLIMASGLGSDAYFAASKWFGHWRGGLATATIGGSAAIASVVGTGVASTVVMGTLAYPEMRKYKYDDRLSTGSIVAGTTLGPMIPPSMGFITYGILAEESIGKLFIAGIIPGLMLTAIFIITIIFMCRTNPNLGPATVKASWAIRLQQLPKISPIFILFLLIILGIYLGLFSAMEAGGIGAFMALAAGLCMGRINWQKLKTAMIDSMEFSSLMLLVIGTGIVFGGALGASGLSADLVNISSSFQTSPEIFVAIILLIYLLFGIICDAPIIQILTTPIVVPILSQMGVDLIWFGVVSVLIINLGTITPPYAIGIFMLRTIIGESVPLSVFFKGAIPFCIASLVVAAILFLFPIISTWLPDLMM